MPGLDMPPAGAGLSGSTSAKRTAEEGPLPVQPRAGDIKHELVAVDIVQTPHIKSLILELQAKDYAVITAAEKVKERAQSLANTAALAHSDAIQLPSPDRISNAALDTIEQKFKMVVEGDYLPRRAGFGTGALARDIDLMTVAKDDLRGAWASRNQAKEQLQGALKNAQKVKPDEARPVKKEREELW